MTAPNRPPASDPSPGHADETRHDSPRVLVPPPLIFAGLLAAGLSIERNFPPSVPFALAAAALAGAGLVLIVAALGLFRRVRTSAEPWRPSTALVASGVYRFTRIPMYLGMAVVCLGVAVLFASLPAALLIFAAALLIDRTVIAREESYLIRRFGHDYRDYRKQVREWL